VGALVPVIPMYLVTVGVAAGPAAAGVAASASADGFLWNSNAWFRRAS
jgi:hypothetical protein